LPAFGREKIPKGGTIPLFGKWFDEAHHPELVEGEGLGEIFRRICLLNYGLIIKTTFD